MSEVMQQVLVEIEKLSISQQEMLAHYMLHVLETEEYIEDENEDDDVEEILREFLNQDGTVNFEKVNEATMPISLDDIYQEN